jgi:UDP-glucose 4-epimerase
MKRKLLTNKTILIAGGTGSLGWVLTRRIVSGEFGLPKKIIIFSRDESKQYLMRMKYLGRKAATEEVIYNNFNKLVQFVIGDIRDYNSICQALIGVDIVINAAALKQVPSCEYFPFEAVQTNIFGSENVVQAIVKNRLNVKTVVGISTDKACKPVNVMGMTKALQERIFISGNLRAPKTKFICVRYGNVLASRGSIIPQFHEQVRSGGPVTVTMDNMTRFLLPLDKAVDIIMEAIDKASAGEIYVPIVPSALILDVAKVLINGRKIDIKFTGIRPGEKINEVLVSYEEGFRTYKKGNYFVIRPMLPELSSGGKKLKFINREYSSSDNVMTMKDTRLLLTKNKLLMDDKIAYEEEFLR